MEGEELDVLIEEIGKVLTDMINDSGELQELLNQVRDLGFQPFLTLDARLTLYNEESDEGDNKSSVMHDPIEIEKEFNSLISSTDKQFLKSLHIKLNNKV